MKYLLTALLALSVGCNKGGSVSPGANIVVQETGKDLFSAWSRTDNSYYRLDLSGGQINTTSTMKYDYGSAVCGCHVTPTGSYTSGTYTLSDCVYVNSASPDPGCSLLNGSGTYTKTDTSLQICNPGCNTYQ